MSRASLIVIITLFVTLPALPRGRGGGHGSGGMHGGFGGIHQGFRGRFQGGFHQPFDNNFRIRNFGRPPFSFDAPGFGGGDAGYRYPFDYGYLDDDALSDNSLGAGNQSSVSPVIALQVAPNIVSYVPVDSRNASVGPVIPDYFPPPSQTNPTYAPTLYLIAFQDNIIRAVLAYWTEGSTLNYVTVDHEQKQAPLASVDRALSERLNGERHVMFRLP